MKFSRPLKYFTAIWMIVSIAQTGIILGQDIRDWDTDQEEGRRQQCMEQRSPDKAGERPYTFREVKWPYLLMKAYGPRHKRWYEKVLGKIIPGYEPNLFQYKKVDINFIEGKYGRSVPLGETERSRKIRLDAERKLKEAEKAGNEQWARWLARNPAATEAEKLSVRSRTFARSSGTESLPSFDWRQAGIDLLPVKDQGFNCNSCWAFSTLDAMQISRQLDAKRADRPAIDRKDGLVPSVPRLVSCMMPKVTGEELCAINWHGEAFSYIVDRGLPFGVGDSYDGSGYPNWVCDRTESVKALTWDYVSSTPHLVPDVAEIKRSLVTYGPLVTTMNLDDCLMLYGGGIFDEEIAKDGPYHMLLIVGWDDAKGAWLVKNSFGDEWGEGGFGWVKYGSNNIGKWSAWIMADPKVEQKLASRWSSAVAK
jgi:C1A family cysteine protease